MAVALPDSVEVALNLAGTRSRATPRALMRLPGLHEREKVGASLRRRIPILQQSKNHAQNSHFNRSFATVAMVSLQLIALNLYASHMRIFSLVAHPRPSSFCHAISERARRELSTLDHEVLHHDLYAEGFGPCLLAEEAYSIGDTLEGALSRAADPVTRQHRSEIASAEGLLVVHPNWWGKPPAILAGWLDRILVPGVAYRLASADGLPEGLLSIKKALIFNTSDTHAERERTELGDPLELIWGRCVLPYCGVEAYHRHVFRPVVGSSDEQRKSWLEEAEGLSRRTFQSGS